MRETESRVRAARSVNTKKEYCHERISIKVPEVLGGQGVGNVMTLADNRRIKGLVEGRIRRAGIMRSDVHGWAEDGTAQVLETGESSIRVHCNYPAYKELSEGMEPSRFRKDNLQPAFSIAAQIVRLLFYEMGEVNFNTVRVDVYATFRVNEYRSVERCILTTTAARRDADAILWSNMSHDPERALSYFQTHYHRGPHGEIHSIHLDDEIYLPESPSMPSVHWRF